MACRFDTTPHYIGHCIKSGAGALANLPSRARWFPKGDAASRQRNGSRELSALLGNRWRVCVFSIQVMREHLRADLTSCMLPG
jgi:hypothetical protein